MALDKEYSCPHGCKTQYPITTLRGWKRHMSAKHGRFSEAELQAAENASTGNTDVKQRMEAFSQEIDGVPVEIAADGTAKEKTVAETTAAPASPSVPMTRKIRATPRKVKKVLASVPDKLLQAFKITPDDDDKEALDEAADFLQDIFGFDFEVDESRTTLRSRWWALLWVGGVIGLVALKHKALDLLKPDPDPDPFAKKDDKE